MLSREIAGELKNIRTPFYLYDMSLLRRTLDTVKTNADKYGYFVHYALKANFDLEVFKTVKEYGFGVDCVSGNEVKYAIENGFAANSIVFAGVGKTDEEITIGIENGIFAFNCESAEELENINTIAEKMGKVVNVALRLNPDIDPQTHKHISTGNADSKFGISYLEVEQLADKIETLKNVNITGLHFHVGSQILKMEVFEHLCARVNTLYDWFTNRGFKLTHINVGGGLGIDYDNPDENPIPDFESYFATFANNLKLDENITLHFELGRSIVGQCGEFISTVLYNKVNAAGKNVAIIDGSMTELIRPALYSAKHAIENLNPSDETKVYTLAGTVCESSDIFARDLELPLLKRGDLVTLKSAGAYGAAMASAYNMHDLPESIYR
ncbi:MAG: diaminopimelate decarboxylase [Rikenellaceae bacterium]